MNGRKFAKIKACISVNKEGEPFYKGKIMKKIGMGAYRSVYDLEGTGCVLKIVYDTSEDQADTEWKSYLKLRKSNVGVHILKQGKPFTCVAEESGVVWEMTIQKKAKGVVAEKFKRNDGIYEKFRELRYTLLNKGLEDVHDENIMIHRKRNGLRLKIVDMGRYCGL